MRASRWLGEANIKLLHGKLIDLDCAMQKAAPIKIGANLVRSQIGEKRGPASARDKFIRVKNAAGALQRAERSLGLQDVTDRGRDFPAKALAIQIQTESNADNDRRGQKKQREESESSYGSEPSKSCHRAWQR